MLRERRVMLQNLAARRVYRNQPLGEPRTWAYYVAEIAWLCYRHGGDLASFRRAAPQVPPYFVISDAVAKQALKLVGRRKKWREECGESYRPTSPAQLGKALAVTALECEELDLKTVYPAGWSPELDADRKKRDRERKRERRAMMASAKERQREAKRKREWRARRGRGIARAAEAQRKREEIAASGRSRRSWYRHRGTDGVLATIGTERVRPPFLLVRADGRLLCQLTQPHCKAAEMVASGRKGIHPKKKIQAKLSLLTRRAGELMEPPRASASPFPGMRQSVSAPPSALPGTDAADQHQRAPCPSAADRACAP
jgi:hypothetical protein